MCNTIFFVLFFFCSVSTSWGQWGYRWFGSMESGYQSWTTTHNPNGYQNSDGTEWRQQYKMGIRGYYLTPNIVSYTVSTKYQRSDRRFHPLTAINRSYDVIDLNARFFQNRNLWANTYLKRTWNEYTYGRYGVSSYDNVVGTNVYLLVRQLPNLKLSYQFSNNQSSQFRDLKSHTTSLQLTKNSETSNVRAEFRDEQHTGRYANGIVRNQTFQLNGRWSMFNRSGTLNADVEYNGYDYFQMTRFNVRYLQHFRQRDRLMALYGFNAYESEFSNTYSNLLNVDYRRFLTPLWFLVSHTMLYRQDVQTLSFRNQPHSVLFSNGIEYLKTVGKLKEFTRVSGYFYVDLRDQRPQKVQSVRLNGSLERRDQVSAPISLMHRVSTTSQLDQRGEQYPLYLTVEYNNQIQYVPFEKLIFQNYLSWMDQEGDARKRSLEDRGELSYRLNSRSMVNGGLSYVWTFEPYRDDALYATSSYQTWLIRNLMLSAQTIHTFYRRSDVYTDRYVVKAEYRVREMSALIQWESREEQGKRYSIVQLNAMRSFGM